MSQITSGGAVLTPAYGRDYTSRVDVLRDLNAGKDFVANIGASSGYIGLSDLAETAEVTRLVTDGTPNACSTLYAAAARAAQAMGFLRIQTYILQDEPGTSLKASGWSYEADTRGGDWNCAVRRGRRTDQPQQPKQRWARTLNVQIPGEPSWS